MPIKRYEVGRFSCSWPQDDIDVVLWWAEIHKATFSDALLDIALPRIRLMRQIQAYVDACGLELEPAHIPALEARSYLRTITLQARKRSDALQSDGGEQE